MEEIRSREVSIFQPKRWECKNYTYHSRIERSTPSLSRVRMTQGELLHHYSSFASSRKLVIFDRAVIPSVLFMPHTHELPLDAAQFPQHADFHQLLRGSQVIPNKHLRYMVARLAVLPSRVRSHFQPAPLELSLPEQSGDGVHKDPFLENYWFFNFVPECCPVVPWSWPHARILRFWEVSEYWSPPF